MIIQLTYVILLLFIDSDRIFKEKSVLYENPSFLISEYREKSLPDLNLSTNSVWNYIYYDKSKPSTFYPNISISENGNATQTIVDLLLKGNICLDSIVPDEAQALAFYLQALDKSKEQSDDILACESLRKIISLLLYRQIASDQIPIYIKEHSLLAYDDLELAYNEYYKLKYNSDLSIHKRAKSNLTESDWIPIVKKATKNKWNKLLTHIYASMGIFHEFHDRNINKAIRAYENAITSSKAIGKDFFSERSFTSKMNIGKLLFEDKRINESLLYYKDALQYLSSQKNEKSRQMAYEWLADSHVSLRNFDSAYHYLQLAFKTNNSYQEHVQEIRLSELEEKYQNERLTNDLSQETIRRKQFYITSLSLGGLLTLSLLGFYGLRRINKLKQTNLQQQIKETEQQGQLAAINAQLDGEEQERKRVATTLHDGIASHLTAASFHLQALSNQNDSTQAADKAAQLIVEAAEITRKLSHELYPPVLISDGLVPALNAIISTYNHSKLTFHIKGITTPINIGSDQETKVYYIIVELLQNVIKHSKASFCELNISITDDHLSFSIADDGIGMIGDRKDEGLGLNSIQARLANISGSLSIQNNVPQGTKVVITVPLR